MLVRKSPKSNWLKRGFSKWKRNRKFIVYLCLFGIYSGVIFIVGAMAQKNHIFQNMRHYLSYAKNSVRSNFIKSIIVKPEHITIDINHKNYMKLAYYRDIAFKVGTIPDSGSVSGTITYQNKKYKADIRLNGYFLDHVDSEKWSLRIKLKKKKTILGMREFTILHPKTRSWLNEWFCHCLQKEEGLISVRTGYIDVTINGKHKGIYFIEETFDKILIEGNQLREGIVFRPPVPSKEIPIKLYQKNRILASPTLKKQASLLQELFDAFLLDRIKPGELFDLKKFAKYYAITDLVNGFHQLYMGNVHLYFNPVTGLVEPIGREWNSGFYLENDALCGELSKEALKSYFHIKLLKDERLFKEYIQTLERISRSEYLDSLFKKIDSEMKEKLSILHKDYPTYSFSKEGFYDRQYMIRVKLNDTDPIRVYYHEREDGKYDIFARNQILLPLDILSMQWGGTELVPNEQIVLMPEDERSFGDYSELSFSLPDTMGNFDLQSILKLTYRILGATTVQTTDILPWPFPERTISNYHFVRQEPNHRSFRFLKTDTSNSTIYFRKGDWVVDRNVIIPSGFTVVCVAGVALDFRKSANILTYSPIHFNGSVEDPIRIFSSDSTGQGFIVMSGYSQSVLRHVHFDNLTNPSIGGWELTGAVTFYESPVSFSFCKFMNSRAEDGLNLFRSSFNMDNVFFGNTLSDALDVDFCEGTIEDTYFIGIGNDGIDISGSSVAVNRVFMDGIGDKGLSAGEKSRIDAWNVKITNAEICVASKDLSIIKAKQISLNDSKIGFAAFQKKPEFGRGSISATDVKMENLVRPYLVEKRSELDVNGKEVVADAENVNGILYGVEYGKSSK